MIGINLQQKYDSKNLKSSLEHNLFDRLKIQITKEDVNSEDKILKLKHLPITYFDSFFLDFGWLGEDEIDIIWDILHSLFSCKKNLRSVNLEIPSVSFNNVIDVLNSWPQIHRLEFWSLEKSNIDYCIDAL